jgi:mannose-6-phosphate isomerase
LEKDAMLLSQPLRFQPLFRRYLWGGRRLGTVLNKPIGEGEDYAESWELVDHGADQSVVLAGEAQGKTLHELVQQAGASLLGRHHPQSQFPLLFKFLDCRKDLSLQVHPNDEQARRQTPPDLGKTEAWIILDAEPGSVIYTGLKRGFDRPAVEREIARGTLPLCLNKFEPQAGDCIFIPAGIVHALGAGFLVAEIQQASDTTFRLFDWNRVGPDGKPRALHIEQGLAVTDFSHGPVMPQTPQPTDQPHIERLVSCDKFVLDRWQIASPQSLAADDRFHLMVVLAGEVRLENDPVAAPVRAGEIALLPASCQGRKLQAATGTVLLDIYLP